MKHDKFTRFLGAALSAILATSASAAFAGDKLPEDGKQIVWRQPSGKELTLKVFGDQLYARTLTTTGYSVVFVPDKKAYFYATLTAQGKFQPTEVPAELAAPEDIAKNLKEAAPVVEAKRAKNRVLQGTNNTEWEALKKNAEARRLQEGK